MESPMSSSTLATHKIQSDELLFGIDAVRHLLVTHERRLRQSPVASQLAIGCFTVTLLMSTIASYDVTLCFTDGWKTNDGAHARTD